MKKIINISIMVLCMFILTSCGHTMYHKVQGTGVYGRIPLPNGNSLIEVAIGDMAITSGILRGGTVIDENTSKGGTFASVTMATHKHLSTTPALNEGNIRDVLTSPYADEKTKQLVAQYLITRSQRTTPSSAVTTINSASATGNKDSIPDVKPTTVGIDNVVNKVAQTTQQVVPAVAPVVADASKDITKSVSEATQNSVKNVADTSSIWIKNIKFIIIAICFTIVIIAILIVLLILKFKKLKVDKVVQQIIKK